MRLPPLTPEPITSLVSTSPVWILSAGSCPAPSDRVVPDEAGEGAGEIAGFEGLILQGGFIAMAQGEVLPSVGKGRLAQVDDAHIPVALLQQAQRKCIVRKQA